jgi:Rrf2 family protein
MRLELGRRADYAIRAVVDLAGHHDAGVRRKARDIAEEMGIPGSYLPQILAALVRAGVVASVAGPAGGYALARAPETVSLLDVVRAVEGDVASTSCVLRGGPCRWEDHCAVHVPWARAQLALLASLDATSRRDLVTIDARIAAGTYRIPDDLRPGDPTVEPVEPVEPQD